MAAGTSLLSQINHIVVVMLENRSFDHMLGFLYQSSNNVSATGQPFEGLTGKESNLDANGKPVTVFPITANVPHPYLQPGADPGEGYLNTNSQLFGKQQAPAPITPANNSGFVTNFAFTLSNEAKQSGQVLPGTQPSQIMALYTPATLPILSRLATGYAVCDHWYASVPTETFPNRAFLALATSQGFVQDKSCSLYTAPSIFTALTQKSVTWMIYGYDAPALTRGQIADIQHAPETQFGEFADFQKAAKAGSLANYCFLEPQWGTQGNSQHPDYDVSKGEQFLHDIYYSLMNTPAWNQTLLIITYDEHGGCYDHVAPPENAVAPDNSVGELGFDFKRFGLRVPTVLVSPLIAAGTVFRTSSATPFDHTSILATVEKRFAVRSLTRRDAAAPDVGAVLTLQKPRPDDPLSGVKVPVSAVAPRSAGPDKFEAAIAASAADLPIDDPTGNGHHYELPAFKTGEQAKEYARQRYRQFAQQRTRKK
jgi:phospholipase C